MNTKRVNAAADVICRARKQGKALPAGWAAALESACLLQSPDTADEQRALLARVAELEAERHSTNEELSKAVERVAELEAAAGRIRRLHTDSVAGPCPKCFNADAFAAGGDGLVPYPCSTARLAGAVDCDPLPMVPARQRQPEDPHDSPLHHDYALGRDLREVTP
ncbi:hypothetical protein ACGF1Z_31430 [Streptomyces sp. NPDC048018]|uniref:hypothetical protein n=1 Tax=Streptomyces sp. NPDC048018 TaxID=3365499 RepID=UPI003717519F